MNEDLIQIIKYRNVATHAFDIMGDSHTFLDVGDVYWLNDAGKLHRDDGPAVERANGTKMWYRNGLRHRIGHPAIVCDNGNERWYIDGKLHRIDGPAIKFGEKKRWFLDGVNYNQHQHELLVQDILSQNSQHDINDHLTGENNVF